MRPTQSKSFAPAWSKRTRTRKYGEADEAEVARRLAEVELPGQGETVLIVDDEPSVRMLVTKVLEELGYTAIEAADNVAGMKVLQ